MASPSQIKNVAVVGATGNLGTLVVSSLLAAQKFTITAISRNPPSTPFSASPSLVIKTGDYSSPSFLSEIFTNQDAVVLTLHWSAVPDLEIKLIEAAAAAGVKWIFPVEYGSDNGNKELEESVPHNVAKRGPREKIEELAGRYEGLKWIGVITNPWFDYSMKNSAFQVDVKNKTALLLSGGTAKFNTTNIATVGLAIARLLSLPVTSNTGASLSDFGNRFVYIRSFLTSQREILAAVQKVTKTTDADWTITHVDGQAWIDEGPAKLAKGDFSGMYNLVFGNAMTEGHGGDFESTKGVSNGVLGLPDESLEDAVRAFIQKL